MERHSEIQRKTERGTKGDSDRVKRTDKVMEPEKWVYKKHT